MVQAIHFLLCNILDIFGSLTQTNGGSSGPTVVYALGGWLIAIFSLHEWLVSHCCRDQLAHASQCTVVNVFGTSYSTY